MVLCKHLLHMETVPQQCNEIVFTIVSKVYGYPFLTVHSRVFREHLTRILRLDWYVLLLLGVYIPVTLQQGLCGLSSRSGNRARIVRIAVYQYLVLLNKPLIKHKALYQVLVCDRMAKAHQLPVNVGSAFPVNLLLAVAPYDIIHR